MKESKKKSLEEISGIDWQYIVRKVLEHLVIPQKDLAEICKVTPQTVSNWKNNVRKPGYFAKRKLLDICSTANIPQQAPVRKKDSNVEYEHTTIYADSGTPEIEAYLQELSSLAIKLSPSMRKEVLDYTRYKSAQKQPT